MDKQALPPGYLKVGKDYYDALLGLGLRSEGVLWAWDKTISDFVLILITSHIDHAGPLAISEALFKAYNAAATPQEISPFIVRLHSPDQLISQELKRHLPLPKEGWVVQNPDGTEREDLQVSEIYLEVHDIAFSSDWVVAFQKNKADMSARMRSWRRFSDNVAKLAA